jgi:hypothetical protein
LFENKREKKLNNSRSRQPRAAAQTPAFETSHRDENIPRLVHIKTTRKIFIMENSNDNK